MVVKERNKKDDSERNLRTLIEEKMNSKGRFRSNPVLWIRKLKGKLLPEIFSVTRR